MQITATFNSWEEFQQFINQPVIMTKVEASEPENVPEPQPKAEKPKKAKAEAPKEEPKAEAPKGDPKAIDYDALRVECRKVLAELNKATGKNTASEIIRSHGADKLTNVEDIFLPALLEEAKEALSDAK